jgi:hypothetical protein
MKTPTRLALVALACCCLLADTEANSYRRQYYSGRWSYYSTSRYYYQTYYYRTKTTYSYHYCVYYPSQPRYVYYYNPHRGYYWGRFELDQNGKGVGYSLLAEKDRKQNLKDIPDSAFTKPAAMPAIPESTDGAQMDPPPVDDLPKE